MAKESDRLKQRISTYMKSVHQAEDKSSSLKRQGKIAEADQWAAQARQEKLIVSKLKTQLKEALAKEKND